MKVGKKASVKAIKHCSDICKKELGALTSWEQCFNIIMEGFIYDIHTDCQSRTDTTTIKLFKEPGEKEDLIETFIIPNSDCYDWKSAEWNWNLIYKTLTEFLMKNRKKILKPKKSKKK